MSEPSRRLAAAAGRSFVRERFMRPVAEFASTEALGGIVLLLAAAVALVWANSPWKEEYFDLWNAHLAVDFNLFAIEESLGHAVNDGLMAVFFFVVGLEIKRELVRGELATVRKATLPVAAALGGMIAPACIYLAFNGGGDGRDGWGIPMATDIAFAMGVLALLGKRAPFSLKVFLLALAIADDLGAIIVIAVFYTDTISFEALAWAAAIAVVILLTARANVRSVDVYIVLGVVFWLAVFKSGIHATIAGVLLAMMTPSKALYGEREFERSAMDLMVSYRHARDRGDSDAAQQVLSEFESLSRDTESPLDRLERALHPWASYLIVPIFALANAGVSISSELGRDAAGSAISAGIVAGLVIGKPVGIVVATFIVVRLKLSELPSNVGYAHILGAGLIGGIGFTVSLFITGLAFDSGLFVDEAKIGILAASLIAGLCGFVYLWVLPGEPQAAADEELATEASPAG